MAKNTPRIRFAGYTDAWEQRKLDDLCSLVTKQTGFDYSTTIKPSLVTEHLEGTLPFIQNKDFSGNTINMDTDFYISEEIVKKYPKITLDQPCLLISISGKIGNVGLYKRSERAFIGGAVGICRLMKDTNGEFIMQELLSEKGQKYFQSLIKASSHQNITVEDIRKIEISMPSALEQERISTMFDHVDNLITIHQRKYDGLLLFKKSMLQKMFPKGGETKPEIRFVGFTDAWEQCKLRDLIIEYKETVDADCTLPILTSSKTEGVVLQEDHFGSKQRHDITGYNILPRGYCTYRNRSDGVDFTFNINKCCDKGIISKFYPVFYGNNNNINFISLVLNHSDEVVHEIGYTCIGTGQKVLSFNDLQKMNIRIPCLQEQDRISRLFELIDNTITLHQRKLEQLKNVKKALLQNMFV